MSFAEDNGLDAYDIDDEDIIYPDELWREGIHVDRQGNEYKLTDMTAYHLQNTINYFSKDYDTSPLEKELAKRNG